ncbi:hypothetical protein [Brevundimonas sp.]|uniref:hypothetical protein n=1 Tax=Brevundimonas sp. TaxID=1871086 RepID=UPI0025B87101|nr:hypothetical protein [Brevundimonas sp.]
MSDLPDRDLLTTREICAWRRITPETFCRRRSNGALNLKPCDRGREQLFARADVLRAFGVLDEARTTSEPEWRA